MRNEEGSTECDCVRLGIRALVDVSGISSTAGRQTEDERGTQTNMRRTPTDNGSVETAGKRIERTQTVPNGRARQAANREDCKHSSAADETLKG